MHIADGVLSTSVIAVTYGAAAAGVAIGIKGIKEEDIPKISLMSATFFAVSLISIPVPPSSVHPLLCGLIGIILGRQAALAFLPALLLQALLFKHGGITALGANTIMLFIPAYLSYLLYKKMPVQSMLIRGGIVGAVSVVMTVVILIMILAVTDSRFIQGVFSIAKIISISHLPILIVETFITAFAVQFINKNRPNWIK